MPFLLDTNVLLRLANVADPLHGAADRAIVELHRRGEVLHIPAQNLIEFRNAATRPATKNGLGMTVAATEAEAAAHEAHFPLLPETPAIYPAWKLVVAA